MITTATEPCSECRIRVAYARHAGHTHGVEPILKGRTVHVRRPNSDASYCGTVRTNGDPIPEVPYDEWNAM